MTHWARHDPNTHQAIDRLAPSSALAVRQCAQSLAFVLGLRCSRSLEFVSISIRTITDSRPSRKRDSEARATQVLRHPVRSRPTVSLRDRLHNHKTNA